MSRCRHARGRYSNPYVEFNFENSLRNYGKTANKMTKRCLHDHRLSSTPRNKSKAVNRQSEFRKQIIQREQGGREEVQLVSQSQQRSQPDQLEPHVDKESIENESFKGPLNDQPAQPMKQDPYIVSIQPFFTLKLEQKQSANEKDQYFQDNLLNGLGNQSEFEKEPSIFDQNSSLSFFSHGPAALTVHQEGGRFRINDRISISKRRLNRFLVKHKSIETILDHIMKKRSYLANEREEIAKRLESYLIDY